MATTPWGTTPDLENDLLHQGHEFSYFQAMRLLSALTGACGADAPLKLRIRSQLSLAFPCADVASIEKNAGGYQMTVTFLGLYGPASPLPTFYTEQLLDEALSDLSTTRDFLDVVNQRIYELLYQGLGKYRLLPQGEEQQRYLELLLGLIGMAEPAQRGDTDKGRALVWHAGLLGMRARSALGLATLLKSVLQVPVKVVQCVERQVPIPTHQRMRIGLPGARLGEAVVGEEVRDRNGKFRVQVGPLDLPMYLSYLPCTANRCSLDGLIRSYLKAPLVWDVELVLAAGEAPAASLGFLPGGRLGCDSWLAPDPKAAASATYPAAAALG